MALTLNVRAAKKFADAESAAPNPHPAPVAAPVVAPTPEPTAESSPERHDQYPVKLKRGRVAYLTLPADFGEADVNHLIKWVRLIAKHAAP